MKQEHHSSLWELTRENVCLHLQGNSRSIPLCISFELNEITIVRSQI